MPPTPQLSRGLGVICSQPSSIATTLPKTGGQDPGAREGWASSSPQPSVWSCACPASPQQLVIPPPHPAARGSFEKWKSYHVTPCLKLYTELPTALRINSWLLAKALHSLGLLTSLSTSPPSLPSFLKTLGTPGLLLFLKHSKVIPAPGLWHVLLPLPRHHSHRLFLVSLTFHL